MKQKQLTKPIESSTDNIRADAWNRSVKMVTMLYHWKLADGYEVIFRLIQLHQKWILQTSFKYDNTLLPQLLAQLPPITEPRIWACFHVGPYALLARALLTQGHGIAVLLKDEVYEEQYPQYLQQFKRAFGREPRPAELCFVRSSGNQSLVKLRQCLENGFHVLCYIDGQEGATGEKGWTSIQLHGTPISVRMGMAVLSQWTRTPVCPIVLTAHDDKLKVRHRQGIQIESREDYAPALQYCYQLLERLKPEELVQWEFLPTLFDKLGSGLLPPTEGKALWLPARTPDKYILFDVVSKQAVEVSREVFLQVQRDFTMFKGL